MTAFVTDTFTGTNGTLLSSHTPELGGAAVLNPVSSGTAVINTGRLVTSASGTAFYTYPATPPSADYSVSGTLAIITDASSQFAAIGGRASATIAEGYFLRYAGSTHVLELFKLTPSLVSLGTFTVSGGAVGNDVMKLVMNGNQISAQYNGATVIGPITDGNPIMGAGKVAVRPANTVATTGPALTAISADDLPVLVPTLVTAPVISGTRVVGYTLTTTNGAWNGSPIPPFLYRWLRDSAPISGATASTYLAALADVGTTITSEVTAVNGSGSSTPATSSNSLVIAAPMVFGDGQWLAGGPQGLGGTPGAVLADPRAIFDDVLNSEAVAGDEEYRLVYFKNGHTIQTVVGLVAWILANTSSTDTALAIGVATEAINTEVGTIPNESTAPAGVVFGSPTSNGAGFAMGDIPPGQFKGLWLRRTVTASASATGTDTATWTAQGVPT